MPPDEKRPGVGLMIAIGKPKNRPSRPSGMGLPPPPDEEEPQQDDDIDQKTYDCVKRCEKMLIRVCDALGVEPESGDYAGDGEQKGRGEEESYGGGEGEQ